jgi:hypothetical protein
MEKIITLEEIMECKRIREEKAQEVERMYMEHYKITVDRYVNVILKQANERLRRETPAVRGSGNPVVVKIVDFYDCSMYEEAVKKSSEELRNAGFDVSCVNNKQGDFWLKIYLKPCTQTNQNEVPKEVPKACTQTNQNKVPKEVPKDTKTIDTSSQEKYGQTKYNEAPPPYPPPPYESEFHYATNVKRTCTLL